MSYPQSLTKDNKDVDDYVDVDSLQTEQEKSMQYTETEHSLTFWKALQLHYPAVLWGLFINLATVLKGMDGGIVGSLVGLDPFKE